MVGAVLVSLSASSSGAMFTRWMRLPRLILACVLAVVCSAVSDPVRLPAVAGGCWLNIDLCSATFCDDHALCLPGLGSGIRSRPNMVASSPCPSMKLRAGTWRLICSYIRSANGVVVGPVSPAGLGFTVSNPPIRDSLREVVITHERSELISERFTFWISKISASE